MYLLIEMNFRFDMTNFYTRHQTMRLFFLFATFNCLCFLFGGSSFVTALSTAKHTWVSTYKTTTANAHDNDENEPWHDTDYGRNAKSQKKQVSSNIHAPLNVEIWFKCIKSTNIFDLMYDTEFAVLFLQSNISNVYTNIYFRVVHYVISHILQIKP